MSVYCIQKNACNSFSSCFLSLFSTELIGGTPSLKINHGSGTLVLQLTNNIGVADRRWHRLDVRSNTKVREVHSYYCLSIQIFRAMYSHSCSSMTSLPCLFNLKEVRFTLDRCSSAIIMETEGVDSWVMTEDRSSCEIRGVTPNRDK